MFPWLLFAPKENGRAHLKNEIQPFSLYTPAFAFGSSRFCCFLLYASWMRCVENRLQHCKSTSIDEYTATTPPLSPQHQFASTINSNENCGNSIMGGWCEWKLCTHFHGISITCGSRVRGSRFASFSPAQCAYVCVWAVWAQRKHWSA